VHVVEEATCCTCNACSARAPGHNTGPGRVTAARAAY
jgi:hypothetical protein